jgi:O-antigen ligase
MSFSEPSLSKGGSASHRDLGVWAILTLLGVCAVLANAPAPRRVFLSLALLAWIVEWFQRPRIRSSSLPFIPWLLVVLLSTTWSLAPMTTGVDALQEVVSPIAAGLLASSLASRLEHRHLWWPFVLLAIAAFFSVLGALHAHLGFWPSTPEWLAGAYAGRGVASTLGVYLSLVGVAFLALNWTRQTGTQRRLLFLGCCLLMLGLLLGTLGHNRMFWFALLIGLLPWLLLLGRGSLKRKLGLGGGLLVVFVAGTIYSSYVAKIQFEPAAEQVVTQIGASYASDPRWLLWQSWLPVAEERPLAGFGYGSRILPMIGTERVSTGSPALDVAAKHHAHNVLFNIVIQTGLAGLFCFLIALFGVWRLAFGDAQLAGSAAIKWRVAAISLLLGGLSKSMTDDFFWGPAGVVMWLLIGIMTGIGRRTEQEDK